MGLLEKRLTYKPLKYPWALEAWDEHERMHWLPHEVTLRDDIVDWETRLTAKQKEFLTQIFRFFVNADIDVADGYASKFIPFFNGHPEVTMMMLSFAAREAIHVAAYALLVDTVGMPETEYAAFMNYNAMKDKHDYLGSIQLTDPFTTAKSLAVYAGFTEGMQLYSSFAMLIHFERLGRMPGMTNIVRWSLRDEDRHSVGMIKLLRTYVDEYIPFLDQLRLEGEIKEAAKTMVELEDKFIELAFSTVGEDLNIGLPKSEEPLTEEVLKRYIRHITDYRLGLMGYSPLFGEKTNPLPWIDRLLLAPEHTNFFEAKPTEYSRASLVGDIEF